MVLSFPLAVLAQNTKAEGTPAQRIQVMSQKIDTMRRSLQSAISVLKDANKDDKTKKDDKDNLNTPLGRFRALDKEASSVQSDVTTLRGKIDRSEKYEMSDIEQLEDRVRELQTGVDSALQENAALQANPQSRRQR
jgi:predicted  nucleic acid-binding Zn-ribbon protein